MTTLFENYPTLYIDYDVDFNDIIVDRSSFKSSTIRQYNEVTHSPQNVDK